MQSQCPVTYFTENLIFNADKSIWAAFRLKGYDYDFLDNANKMNVLNRMTRLLCGTWSEQQVLGIPVEQNNKEHFRRLRTNLRKTDPLYDAAYSHAEETERYLGEINAGAGDVNDYAFYIIAKLAENTEYESIAGLKEMWELFVKSPKNAIDVFMNTDTVDILESKLEDARQKAKKWFDSQDKKMELEYLDGETLQWLFRRQAFRGLPAPANLFYADDKYGQWQPVGHGFEAGGQKVIRPYRKDIASLFSGAIRHKGRILMIDHGLKGTSYQTFLVITHIPDDIEYPGMEWLYMLQQYNVQSEFCIHMQAVEHREALRKLDHKKQEISSQMDNVDEAGAKIPEDLEIGAEYADAMEAELKLLKAPVLYSTISICLSAATREELEEKVLIVRNAYEDIQFVVERPIAEQYKLYLNHIPSVGNRVRDYILPLSPMILAGGVIGAVHELGDRVGPFIGTTGIEMKQVFLDMGRACLLNKSASATLYGNLGYGKSFNANLLLCLNVLYGGYGLIFDPKGERGHWEKEFKLFQGLITTVELSTDPKFRGKLDPFVMYREDIHTATELAYNVLMEQCRIRAKSAEDTAIKEALNRLKQEYKKGNRSLSMTHLCDALRNFEDGDSLQKVGRDLARSIELDKEIGMSGLLFGDGSEEAIRLDNRLNILMIQNLKLPSPDTKKEDYTSEERLATVIMMVLGQFAKQFALTQRQVFSMILFDESWALGKTAEGVKLIDFLTRMGRSLYTGVILNGHSVLDIPTEGIQNTISYKFCFHTDNEKEAQRMCNYMGIADTPENREVFMSLRNAQCMFRDLDGHVGKLQFDAVFQDMIDVFSTTPTAYTEEPEEENGALLEISLAEEEDLLANLLVKEEVT